MKKQRVKFLLTVICMLAAGICYSCSGRTNQQKPGDDMMTVVLQTEETSEDRDVQKGLISAETKAQETEPEASGEESLQEPMARQRESVRFYVHICGEVKTPGVYALEPGSRIFQVVNLAGGLTEEAAGDYLNMALEIGDGMKITVPSWTEIQRARESCEDVPGTEPLQNGHRGSGTGLGQWIEMPSDSPFETNGYSEEGTGMDSRKKVNLNTASKDELMTLRGIGEARAEDIIRYREEKGPFQTIEEIMNVSGIKEAAFQKIKDSITVQDGAS